MLFLCEVYDEWIFLPSIPIIIHQTMASDAANDSGTPSLCNTFHHVETMPEGLIHSRHVFLPIKTGCWQPKQHEIAGTMRWQCTVPLYS